MTPQNFPISSFSPEKSPSYTYRMKQTLHIIKKNPKSITPKIKTGPKRKSLINREYHVSVFWYQAYRARPETASGWQGFPRQSDLFPVEPTKLDIKRHLRDFLFYHAFIRRFNGEK